MSNPRPRQHRQCPGLPMTPAGSPHRRAILAAGLSFVIAAFTGQAASAQSAVTLRCGTQIHANEGGFQWFPQDETFCPFIADPKQPRSFLALQRGEFGTLGAPEVAETTIGAHNPRSRIMRAEVANTRTGS